MHSRGQIKQTAHSDCHHCEFACVSGRRWSAPVLVAYRYADKALGPRSEAGQELHVFSRCLFFPVAFRRLPPEVRSG